MELSGVPLEPAGRRTPPERAGWLGSGGLAAARIAAAGGLVALAAAVLRPFLTSLAWGAILAYVTWPAWRRLPGRERRPGLCAAALTAAVAIGIGIPVALLLVALADEASAVARRLFGPGDPRLQLPALLASNPWLERAASLAETLGLFDASRAGEWLGRAGSEISGRLVSLAGGVLHNAFKFGVAMVSLYAFYLSGEHLIDLGRRLAPLLFPGAPARFVESIGDAVSAVMFGLLGTAIAQGVLAGIGLAVAGVPSPVLLGAATALLSVVPFGGGMISLFSAAWLALGGRWLAALALVLWSLLVVSSMDNLLRPILISGRARIPFLLVFLGVLGGLAGFGLIGAFVGPVILSVLFALLLEFSRIPPPAVEAPAGPPLAAAARPPAAGRDRGAR